jgi:hypothetical protein
VFSGALIIRRIVDQRSMGVIWCLTCSNKFSLTPKGPETIFKPFLKFGQAIVKAIFIKKS